MAKAGSSLACNLHTRHRSPSVAFRGLILVMFDNAMRDIKLPKYESWPNYGNFLPMNIERYCDYYNRGI